MQKNDDALIALIARCALKDQASLKQLYEQTSRYLNAIGYRILRDDEAANEVLQEAFVQIWENASSYRPDIAKPLTWMSSILRYRALDRLEKEKRLQNRIVSMAPEDLLNKAEESEGAATDHTGDDINPHIVECLGELNQKISESIKLAYIHGYSREELAQRFDANVNTVKSWLKRGSERLKLCLETKLATGQ